MRVYLFQDGVGLVVEVGVGLRLVGGLNWRVGLEKLGVVLGGLEFFEFFEEVV